MNKIWQAVGILFAINAGLLLCAFIYEHTFAEWDKEAGKKDGFRFITMSDVLTADTSAVNKNAEALTDKLLQADSLVITKMKKRGKLDSAFLVKSKDTSVKDNKIFYAEALDAFFDALVQERADNLIRVAHFGDSQLEGDRVTSHIRRNLQAKFGGSGLGYIPMDDVASSSSYAREQTGTWTRFNVFNNKHKTGFYGLSGCVFRFAKGANLPDSVVKDSTKKDSGKTKVAKFGNNASLFLSFNKGQQYDKVSLMYGRSAEPFGVRCYANGNSLVYADTVEPESSFGIKPLQIPAGLRNVKIEFVGNASPDLYGLQVDGSSGITVDNYAIRGHSGDGLFKINSDFLAEQVRETNTRLIIFQYGANMIPYLESEKECQLYEKAFYELFMKFRRAAPNASILVIGNGDMGYKSGGESVSYPYVRCLSDVLKSASQRSGCAYWSLLDAMGGDNSILTWTRKGISSLDGHLSPKGQEIMANLIFRAIMIEYNNYVLKQEMQVNINDPKAN